MGSKTKENVKEALMQQLAKFKKDDLTAWVHAHKHEDYDLQRGAAPWKGKKKGTWKTAMGGDDNLLVEAFKVIGTNVILKPPEPKPVPTPVERVLRMLSASPDDPIVQAILDTPSVEHFLRGEAWRARMCTAAPSAIKAGSSPFEPTTANIAAGKALCKHLMYRHRLHFAHHALNDRVNVYVRASRCAHHACRICVHPCFSLQERSPLAPTFKPPYLCACAIRTFVIHAVQIRGPQPVACGRLHGHGRPQSRRHAAG
jgi:hypothetical protein